MDNSEEPQKYKSVAILGRQPALGIAELESLYGSEHILPFGPNACFIDLDACNIDFNRLGGSVRIGTVLLKLPSPQWRDIEKLLVDAAPEHAAKVDGKLIFGLSVFGLKISPKAVAKTALLMKKAIKNSGKSVRMVPHKTTELGSAVVLYNKLHRDGNWELVVVSDGKSAYLAQTNFIQDIDAYAARDQARPYRDAKVGMLPPKLAQIIINLATRKQSVDTKTCVEGAKIGASTSIEVSNTKDIAHEKHSAQADLHRSTLVLDPFCGTGVLLQEAMLMDYDIYGTDLEPRMVQYTIDNLKWLDGLYPNAGDYRRIEIADATTHHWSFPDSTTIVIAGETYLGKPLAALPPSDQLSKVIYDANLINHKFLQNISSQIPSGTKLCLAMPAWRGKHEFLHLPLLDHITDMGYTRHKFKHVSNEDLIYHRENQVVARELVVLEKD